MTLWRYKVVVSTFSSLACVLLFIHLSLDEVTINMLSVGITSHAPPSAYQLLDLSRPEIKDPQDVLIKVHAASVNPVDLKKAEGVFKVALKESYVKISQSPSLGII